MKRSTPIPKVLIAPCGMNCAICSRYLAYAHKMKRSQCAGCRPRNERCTYLFAKCRGINHTAKSDAVFCFKCSSYPCAQINRADNRYRRNYDMSLKENLEHIKSRGIGSFIEEQYEKYRCAGCGGLRSVQNGKCFACDSVTKLVDLSGRRKAGRKRKSR